MSTKQTMTLKRDAKFTIKKIENLPNTKSFRETDEDRYYI